MNEPSRMQIASQTIDDLNELLAKRNDTITSLMHLAGRQSEARQAAERERDELAEALLDRWPFNVGRIITSKMRLQKMTDWVRHGAGPKVPAVYRNKLAEEAAR